MRADTFKDRRWQENTHFQQAKDVNFQDLAQMVMRKKVNTEGEFFVNFFEKCNLSCNFCYQKHDDWTGIENIAYKAEQILKRAAEMGDRYSAYQINMMGGELFMDEVPDSVMDDYYQFVVEVDKGLRLSGKSTRYHIVTNLMFDKTDRVLALLDRFKKNGYDVPICISYDFVGRFNRSNYKQFCENVEIFFDRIKMVSVVLTKQNIEVMLGKRKETVATMEYLRSLYDRGMYTLFDYFSPQHNADVFSPSDEEMYDAFVWLMEHFPKSGPICDMLENRPQYMSCRDDQIVQPDGEIGRCRILVDKRTLQDFESQPHNFKAGNMQGQFIDRMGCLQCEYFERCGLGCFLLHDYNKRVQMDSCLFRKLYQKIEGLN